jgi:DNA-binding FadR family transcriptional regulator
MQSLDLASILPMLADGVPQPAHERIALALRRAITLRISPGDRLPSERQLAEWFGVSRVTVRLAFALLRDEGLIEPGRSRRSGTASTPRQAAAPYLKAAVILDARDDIADILAYRSLIEPTAARLAARFGDEQLVVRMQDAVEAMSHDPDPTTFRRADSSFHLAVAEASRNRRLLQAILVTRAELLRWRDLIPMPDDVAENLRDHGLIAEAISDGDEEAASTAMANHLERTLASFLFNVRAAPLSDVGNVG